MLNTVAIDELKFNSCNIMGSGKDQIKAQLAEIKKLKMGKADPSLITAAVSPQHQQRICKTIIIWAEKKRHGLVPAV
jgi:Holliday junction resolvase-like predicted endonuclease